jgi:LysM repeat protein
MSVKRSRKLARFIVGSSLLIVIGAGFSAAAHSSTTGVKADKTSYMTIVVAPGETLWSIAGLAGGNAADIVSTIVDANHLATSDLHAGQRILVPVQ